VRRTWRFRTWNVIVSIKKYCRGGGIRIRTVGWASGISYKGPVYSDHKYEATKKFLHSRDKESTRYEWYPHDDIGEKGGY
jgi:hypothetical protein